jgi:hypothetical protein
LIIGSFTNSKEVVAMNQAYLILAIVLLGGGCIYFYSMAAINGFRINTLTLKTEHYNRDRSRRVANVIIQLTIFVTLGGMCLALIIFLIFGGSALSLGGCITSVSCISGLFYGVSTIWRSHLVRKIKKKTEIT